jgi:thioredoxin-related protein
MRRVNAARGLPPDLIDVRSVPTFILRDKGREVGRIIGYSDPLSFYRNVDRLLAAAQ